MKRIKHIGQLKAEKKRLKERQNELEKAIKYDWRDLKESMRPRNVAAQVFSKVLEKEDTKKENNFVADSLSQIAANITRIIVEKTENKLGKWFKK